MKNDHLSGRWSIVSARAELGTPVLIGFLGDVYPHDLTADNITYIKRFCGFSVDAPHTFYEKFPDEFTPAYPAAKTNFINGFMSIGEKL